MRGSYKTPAETRQGRDESDFTSMTVNGHWGSGLLGHSAAITVVRDNQPAASSARSIFHTGTFPSFGTNHLPGNQKVHCRNGMIETGKRCGNKLQELWWNVYSVCLTSTRFESVWASVWLCFWNGDQKYGDTHAFVWAFSLVVNWFQKVSRSLQLLGKLFQLSVNSLLKLQQCFFL